jgi:zinc and cadmium transporter
MSTLGFILLFTLIGSIGSLVGGLILLSKKGLAMKISHFLASFAAGTLLATAFFHLLPEAAHEAENTDIPVFVWSLGGIVIFFFIEQFLHWFHHHGYHHSNSDNHELKKGRKIPLLVIGDTLHNFIDGIVIAGSFLVSIPLGITTALSVAAHEIPQEIGDFGLMIQSGMKRGKVIMISMLSAGAALIGAFITYSMGDAIEGFNPIMLSITAGFFIYLALADIVPEIHQEENKKTMLLHSALLLLGIMVIWIATTYLETHA